MKSILLLLFSMAILVTFGQHEIIKVDHFGKNKGNLKMYHYVPANLDATKDIPLVIVVHGCTQSAELIAKETAWNKLADSLNFIVIYPEQKQINNLAKCYNFYICYNSKKDKGEVSSIKDMLDYTLKTHHIDSSKIFITGFSAGGAISNAMLNAYPTLFNAGALFSAPSNLFNPNKKQSKDQPKVAIIQGYKDLVVPKGNANRILKQWTTKNQIADSNFTVIEKYLDHPMLSAKEFHNANHELKIISITAKDLKHKLMISPGTSINKGGVLDFHTIDLNFHSTYWAAQFFGLLETP
jgi:poly(3-hydroxybutyrate) depolymerase